MYCTHLKAKALSAREVIGRTLRIFCFDGNVNKTKGETMKQQSWLVVSKWNTNDCRKYHEGLTQPQQLKKENAKKVILYTFHSTEQKVHETKVKKKTKKNNNKK